MDIVKLLVEEGGASVEEEALSLARENDHNEVAEFLLKHVDLYSSLEGDTDAIMEKVCILCIYYTMHGKKEQSILIPRHEWFTLQACREGDVNMVRKLLEDDNYNYEKWKDEDGKYMAFSPMYLAVKNGHMEVVQLFAEMGVQMDVSNLDTVPEASAE